MGKESRVDRSTEEKRQVVQAGLKSGITLVYAALHQGFDGIFTTLTLNSLDFRPARHRRKLTNSMQTSLRLSGT